VVLANPGEGIEGGTVTAVMVKAGDAVKVGQGLVEVSTDKASMEVTAEVGGTVEAVHVKPGDKVLVGKYSGTELKLDGVEYVVLREDDLFGVIEQ